MQLRTLRLSALLFAVALGACSPHVGATNAAPKPNAPSPLYVNEDFTLWHTEGTMAPTIHMEMAPGTVNAQANGAVAGKFDAAGTLTLVREIPMPGDSVIQLTGSADISNAALKAQLWKDGRMLAERGNGGAIDIAVRSSGAGIAKCVLILGSNGRGSVSIRDAHISIEKSDLSHARVDGVEPLPAH